jgi:CBS domain-containing protein
MTLEPQMTLREAMEILTAREVSGAPVVSGQRVVGVISATDLLSFAAAPPRNSDRWTEPSPAGEWNESAEAMENYLVEDVMTKKIRWLSPDADVRSAADMMREFGVHRVLVLNRGHLVGLVSAMDIAKAVAERQLPNRSFVFDSSPVTKTPAGSLS